MATKNDSKKTTKTAKAKKGDAKNSKKPKAPETAAPETTKVPEPVSPPPVTAPAATEGEVMDGHTVHEALKHVLNACPKADGPDGNPALAFVLLDRDTLLATDDFAHHKAFLPQPASTGPVKITRASLRGLQKKLDGELKSGAETSTAVTVVWSGLIVEVHGVGETHHVTLQKFDGGPDPKHLHLAASPVGDGVRVPLDLLRRVKWKGDRSVLVYTDPATGRVCLDAVAGPDTIYRAVVAATGHNLGIRQPSLPGVSATPKPPPQAPTPPAPPSPTGQDGEEPPEVTVWIHEDAWNALTPEQRADFEEPLAGSGVDWDGTDEYVFARVPRDEVLTTLQGIAEGHGVKLVVSATKPLDPPAGDFVDADPDAEVAELRAEINRLHDALRATARACTLPEDTTPEALPAQVEACIRDLSGQIERLTLAATATTGAEDALAGLVALQGAAARAYLEMDGGRTDAITPEVDSGAEPRLALTLDLGGGLRGEPWQALVIYDAGMGTVPVTSGECCGTPLAAVASLRKEFPAFDASAAAVADHDEPSGGGA